MKPRYLRMLAALKQRKRRGPKEWSLYIVRCADGTLYTGIAKDAAARLEKHNAGKGAAYTRTRRPVRLIYSQAGLTHSAALVREAQVKSMRRPLKEKLACGKKAGRTDRRHR
jgi:putative endonuclease